MQRASIENQFLEEGSAFVGVALGFSPGSAHERGFDSIRDHLDICEDREGLGQLRISVDKDSLHYRQFGDVGVLAYIPGASDEEITRAIRHYVGESKPVDAGLNSYWGDRGFILVGAGTGVERIRILHSKFLAGDVCAGILDGSVYHAPYPVFVLKEHARESWTKRLM